MATLTNVKALLEITNTSKDNLLNLLIGQSISEALDYCHISASDYSSSSTYRKGDVCINSETIFVCIADIASAEAFDSNHWKEMKLNAAVEQMAVYRYNRLATEGVKTEEFSGVTYDYSSDYPEGILRLLKSNRRLVIV